MAVIISLSYKRKFGLTLYVLYRGRYNKIAAINSTGLH